MNEFKSDAKEKLIEFVKYYKHNPFRYIKLFEGSFGIKLKWYQKILLFIPTKEQRRQKRIEKVLKKYSNVK